MGLRKDLNQQFNTHPFLTNQWCAFSYLSPLSLSLFAVPGAAKLATTNMSLPLLNFKPFRDILIITFRFPVTQGHQLLSFDKKNNEQIFGQLIFNRISLMIRISGDVNWENSL